MLHAPGFLPRVSAMAATDCLPLLLLLFVAITHQKILSQILFEVAGDW
jgi:hypothetical protein